jgi:large subunit ribosomal protein L36
MLSQATRTLLRAAPVARSPVSVCARTAFSTYSANSLVARMSQMSLARPVASPTKSLVAFQQTRGMKVRSSVKKLCDGCKVRTIGSRYAGIQRSAKRKGNILIRTVCRVCVERAVNTSTSFAARTPSTSRGTGVTDPRRCNMILTVLQTRLIGDEKED